MQFRAMITAVDSHTAGEPTRVVTGGIPAIPGKTMGEKKEWMARNRDDLRTALMWEPRGHADMFGAVVTAPVSEEAEVGVLFMDGGGYLDMCGHGSIGAVTVLLETGMIPTDGDSPRFVAVDTPAGVIHARADIRDGRVHSVSIRNVPSFFLFRRELEVAPLGDFSVDIAFGGNYFALVNAGKLGMSLERGNIPALVEAGLRIRAETNRAISIVHPETGRPGMVNLVEFYDDSVSPPKNVVVFGEGQVDRSPCGTGTCAKMAALHARGQLPVGEPYVYQSVTGTKFRGTILSETRVGSWPAILPEITGGAFVTGIQQFVMDDRDPFRHGFHLSKNH